MREENSPEGNPLLHREEETAGGHRHLRPELVYQRPDDFGDLTVPEAFDLHLHLLQRCPQCRRRALAYLGLSSLEELAATGGDLEPLLARRRAREGEPLLAWLESLPPAERARRVEEDPKLATPPVVAALLERCRSLWSRDGGEALAWSRLALAAAGALPADGWAAYDADALSARAWAYHGNALRLTSDLRGAAAAFAQARRRGPKGLVPDEVAAEVLSLHASLLRAQRDFAGAEAAISAAIELYAENGLQAEAGRCLLKRAQTHSYRGDYEGALADLKAAGNLVDLNANPCLALASVTNQLYAFCELGRFEHARSLLPEARRLAEELGAPADQLRVLWSEARIAAAQGPETAAEAAFRRAREGFFDLRMPYDGALATLDLAALYAGQGRQREIRHLALEMLPVFQSQGVEGEALAALFLFIQAAWCERVTAELLAQVRRRLAGSPPPARSTVDS